MFGLKIAHLIETTPNYTHMLYKKKIWATGIVKTHLIAIMKFLSLTINYSESK